MLIWGAGSSRFSREAACALWLAQLPAEKQDRWGLAAVLLRVHPGPSVSALTSHCPTLDQ